HVNQDTQQMARVRMVMEFLVERLQGLESVIEISGAL
ncbi:MAG TPA: LysR family transcriptional regulator, partial [Marinobacter hydrocarbonoclasticus]|nr:LysR family transcriptional regulator [Marinobacter nauticus]